MVNNHSEDTCQRVQSDSVDGTACRYHPASAAAAACEPAYSSKYSQLQAMCLWCIYRMIEDVHRDAPQSLLQDSMYHRVIVLLDPVVRVEVVVLHAIVILNYLKTLCVETESALVAANVLECDIFVSLCFLVRMPSVSSGYVGEVWLFPLVQIGLLQVI